MHRISTLIIDDERLSRQRIRRLLAGEPDFDVLAECANGPEAVDVISQRHPDLVFLDVQMPGFDGFKVVENSNGSVPTIIFVTAFDEYAFRAFEARALDYLLKPFDRFRFQETLRRAREHFEHARAGEVNLRLMSLVDELQADRRGCHRLAIRTPGHLKILRTEEIDWIEAADNYVCVHCGQETHILRETMNMIEARLGGAQFQRVHRSTIVNVDRIKELQPWFRGDYRIILRDGTQLTMSRSYRERVESTLLKGS